MARQLDSRTQQVHCFKDSFLFTLSRDNSLHILYCNNSGVCLLIYTVTLLLTKINCMQSFLINMLIRKGHGFCGSVVFSLLLLSLCSSNSTNYTKPWVSTRRTSLNTSLLINSALRVENLKFAVRPTPNLASKALENCSSNNGTINHCHLGPSGPKLA